ncbi:MAG: Rossmann-like domain-containing protein [Candidatus Hecatellaceae archaeon]
MPGTLIGEILAFLLKNIPEAFQLKVKNVCIGLGYTAVQLENGHLGLCSTMPSELGLEGCSLPLDSGKLAGRSLFDLAKLAGSWIPAESIVGIAAVNAASQMLYKRRTGSYQVSVGNVTSEFEVRSSDRVVMVGNIKPIASFLEGKAGELYVLERSPQLRGGSLPDTACEEYLPKADVAVITASTLVNGTIDRLLQLAKGAREVILVGPTSPITPEPLFNHGVTLVGGVRVLNSDVVLRVVMEGGGAKQLREACLLVNIRPRKVEAENKDK